MAQDQGDKLSRRQEQAISALLSEPTLAAAAAAAGCAVRTLKGWLVLPAFAAAYAAARRQVLEQAVVRLVGVTGEAVDTLAANLGADRPGDQIRAAVAILEHAHKGVEVLDLEQRLSALEAAHRLRRRAGK
jgi:hypothetical protein